MFTCTLKRAAFKSASLLFCVCFIQSKGQSPVTPPAAYSSGVNKNYVRTWDATAPITDPNGINTAPYKDVKQVTSYFDGLGRPIQTVVKKGSFVTDAASPASAANAVDFVTAVTYDEFGRREYQYLPFAANSTGGNASISDGLFKLNPFQQQAAFATSQYPGESFFYGKSIFEPAPLERILQQYAPGDSWVGSESNSDPNTRRSVNTEYLFNDENDSVRLWTISAGLPVSSATYDAAQLYEHVQIDEHKNKSVGYKDKQGRTILKKVQISSSPTSGHYGWLCTYYIYDDAGLLRVVLQPSAVDELLVTSWSVTTDIINELAFTYEYDEKQRMIVKKVPGAGEVRMVYDQWDRLVLTQDANLRAGNKWLFTKYDQLNRPIMTGFYVNSTETTQSSMQAYLNAQNLARYETYQTASFPLYSLTSSFPAIAYSDVLTITYYDDYSWAGWYGNYATKDNTWDNEFASHSNWPYPQSVMQSSSTKGLVTGTWDKTNGGLLTASYYDEKGRVIQTKTYNHTGGIDILTTQYTFSGQALQTVLRHQKSGTNSQTHLVQTRTSFDEAHRLIKIEKKLSSTIGSTNIAEDWHAVASLEYDALGQIKKKTLAPAYNSNVGLDTLSSIYNIRGWLTSINKGYVAGTADAWFGMELSYDKDGYATFSNKHYNGNITGNTWRTRGDGEKRKYEFSYDAANRLLKADFTQQSGSNWNVSAGIDYSMKMGDGSDPNSAYDANGNIRKMWQRGWKLGGSVTIDSLIYQSNTLSNKLKYVRDGMNDPGTTLGDFKESAQNNSDNLNSNAADYSYDANGNMNVDNNKGISAIAYNHLNLPTSITVTNKGSIEYVYDNGGNKLKKIVHETGKPDKTTLYVAGFVYENDTVQLLMHEEGRIRLTTDTANAYTGYAFDYFEKDHLGNVRVLLTEQRDTARYPEASMETGKLARDTLYYSKIPETRVDRSTVSGYPSNDAFTNPNDWVAKTNGSGNKIGPGIVLKVMAGDKFNLRVSSWYKTNNVTPGTPVNPVNDIVAALIAGVAGGGKFGVSELQSSNVLGPNVTSFLNSRSAASGQPIAYVNWILLDEQLNYVSTSSGFEQVPEETTYGNNGSNPSVYVHEENSVLINKNGYLYVYVSNETPNVDVFFDNLQVTHLHGVLKEETHYYPWGLPMLGISSKILKPGYVDNRKKFNSIEYESSLDLNLGEAFFRTHDPQLGKWWQIDPKPTEMLSSYSTMNNNPILLSDPLGDTTWVYNQNGAFIGLVPDNLKNQVHFVKTDGNPAKPFRTKGLSRKDINKLGQHYRNISIAFMGSKTVSDMRKIVNESLVNKKEIGFVGTIGKDKEIRLTALPIDETNKIDRLALESQIDKKYPGAEQQVNLFLSGHTHVKAYIGGFFSDSPINSIKSLANPTDPEDYENNLYRDTKATVKGQSPALVISPYGIVIYGTNQNANKSTNNSYLLYKSLK